MATANVNAGRGQNVKTLHRQFIEFSPKWKKIRHALAGDLTTYLRDVGKNEPDAAYGRQRQKEYEEGAICYNFTKRTLSGMVGSVMRKDPEQIIPSQMEYLLTNCDGSGVGLWQHAQDTLMELDSIGRGGLLVDAPNVEVATMAEQNEGLLNPTIAFYTAENIINWRLKRFGSVNRVDMIVLREEYEYTDGTDEFSPNYGEQYRVLDIFEGKYRQRLYRFDSKGAMMAANGYVEVFPQLGGVPVGIIPFTFIGASNNDSTIDDAPLLPLAELNIGHFRNSADNEESSFVVGQPTLFIAPGENMSLQNFVEANPNGVKMGSRTGHNVGAGGNAFLVQADANNLAKENMLNKEQQAVQIGAQLITSSTQETAEAARIKRGADTSVMATIARNVSSAYTDALKWVAGMLNIGDQEIEFKLNMDFFLTPMTAQDRAAWMADINAGLLPATAYFAALRKAGVTDWTDEQIEEAVANQPLPSATMVTGDIPTEPVQRQQ